VLRRFEDRGEKTVRRRLWLVIDESISPALEVLAALRKSGAVIAQEDYERHIDDGRTSITCEVRTPPGLPTEEIARVLEQHAGVRRVKLERI
jgi:hypothetical protein